MGNLKGKKILLAVTGSIAAYKAGELIRLLRSHEADVKVVMTEGATEFITELTLQALSGHPVHKELLDHDTEARMSHITLARWCDLLLVAPATANIMAKFSVGIADDLLSTLFLASSSPVAIVPAMNQKMWEHPATLRNKKQLEEQGIHFLGPSFGEQACGEIGFGRMIEPAEIISKLETFFAPKLLSGKRIVITAGPTREPIDPVRYISNYSSGKMGYALAQVAQELGGNTLLITGPTSLTLPIGIQSVHVETAEEMHQAVMTAIIEADIFLSAAAVADYRPMTTASEKIKKPRLKSIDLKENIDILMTVGKLNSKPFLVGFAAESSNITTNAREKLQRKNLDMIIANKVGGEDSAFHSDYNQISIITKHHQFDLPKATKIELAREIFSYILAEYNSTSYKQKRESTHHLLPD